MVPGVYIHPSRSACTAAHLPLPCSATNPVALYPLMKVDSLPTPSKPVHNITKHQAHIGLEAIARKHRTQILQNDGPSSCIHRRRDASRQEGGRCPLVLQTKSKDSDSTSNQRSNLVFSSACLGSHDQQIHVASIQLSVLPLPNKSRPSL